MGYFSKMGLEIPAGHKQVHKLSAPTGDLKIYNRTTENGGCITAYTCSPESNSRIRPQPYVCMDSPHNSCSLVKHCEKIASLPSNIPSNLDHT